MSLRMQANPFSQQSHIFCSSSCQCHGHHAGINQNQALHDTGGPHWLINQFASATFDSKHQRSLIIFSWKCHRSEWCSPGSLWVCTRRDCAWVFAVLTLACLLPHVVTMWSFSSKSMVRNPKSTFKSKPWLHVVFMNFSSTEHDLLAEALVHFAGQFSHMQGDSLFPILSRTLHARIWLWHLDPHLFCLKLSFQWRKLECEMLSWKSFWGCVKVVWGCVKNSQGLHTSCCKHDFSWCFCLWDLTQTCAKSLVLACCLHIKQKSFGSDTLQFWDHLDGMECWLNFF